MSTSWIAVYTKPRHEKTVQDDLVEKGIEVFLPLLRQKRKWSDRMKWVELPLFKGYVFVKININDTLPVLETHGVHHIIKFAKVIAEIPEEQIYAIKQMLEGGYEGISTDYFVVGTKVKVEMGPMKGVKGIVSRIDGEDKLVIKIDAIQHAIALHIDRHLLTRVKE